MPESAAESAEAGLARALASRYSDDEGDDPNVILPGSARTGPLLTAADVKDKEALEAEEEEWPEEDDSEDDWDDDGVWIGKDVKATGATGRKRVAAFSWILRSVGPRLTGRAGCAFQAELCSLSLLASRSSSPRSTSPR